MTRRSVLLILLSSVLTALSFHPVPLHFLAWFSFVPLFFALEKMKPGSVFKAGLLHGTLFSLCALFWIVFLQIEEPIKIILLLGLILLFLYYGIYHATALLITKKLGIWFLPLIFTGLEFIRSLGELGFPWLVLGYSQARYPVIIQQASIFGVYGISFWLLLINVALFRALKSKKIKSFFLGAMIFFLPIIYGTAKLKNLEGRPLLIGVIQPNIDPNLKFTTGMRAETFERLISLSQLCCEASKEEFDRSPDLIIWPETAVPVFITRPGKYQDLVLNLSNKIEVPLFTGTPIYDQKTHHIYNGAVLIEPDKGLTQEYRKIHLVPFGEHIPFDQYIPALKKIDVGGGNYTPGNEFSIFTSQGAKFACLICFESIFPDISSEFVKNGAALLINITNDGWFGKIAGPQQHNDMAILRTVENGVPLVRCSNTGISMVVDQNGRVSYETGLFTETFFVKEITLTKGKTVYRIIDDLLPILSLIFVTLLIVFKEILVKKSE